MKLDILAFGAHPDDVELSCSGTLMKHIDLGYKAGIVDLTRGELGTRGSAELRDQESAAASAIMGVSVRENLRMEDGFFVNDRAHQLAVISMIRKYQPDIVLTNAPHDRHPDHGRAAQLTIDACFLAGLPKITTELDGQPQAKWRPKHVYQYIQALFIEPTLVVDITPYADRKMAAIQAYKSQFYDPNSTEEQTYISRPEYMEFIRARDMEVGTPLGYRYAEGFITNRRIAVKDLFDLG